MKKILTLLAAAVLMSGVAFAQNPEGKCDHCKHHQHHDGIEMAQQKTERMAQRYGLDENQKMQLLELNKQQCAKQQKGHKHHKNQQGVKPEGRPEGRPEGPGMNHGNGGPRPEMGAPKGGPDKSDLKKEMKKERKAYKKAVKQIMTKEQFKAYKKDCKTAEKEMKKH